MSFDQSFLRQDAQDYLARLLPAPPSPVFERIEAEARAESQPAVGRVTGGLLRALVASHGARRVLEIGCNLGYSALWMAHGLPSGGSIDTIEIDARIAERARAHFREAGFGERVRVLVGPAAQVLPTLPAAQYDLVFLDAMKEEYPLYLDHALRLLRPGGLVVADNVLWSGRVWDERAQDADTRGVREYTRRIFADPRLASTVVPAEDGLAVSVFSG